MKWGCEMSKTQNQDIILEEQVEDTQKDLFLIFDLGDESYGVEVKIVSEIIGIQPIAELPEMPEYIRGIINLRGKIIPVMDVRLRFNKPLKEYDWRTCIVVIDINDLTIGLIVDSVAAVVSILEGEIAAPPSAAQNESRYIKGIGKSGGEIKLLLDSVRLIEEAITESPVKI
jgi:purine-binding chemotaxis protein CheW